MVNLVRDRRPPACIPSFACCLLLLACWPTPTPTPTATPLPSRTARPATPTSPAALPTLPCTPSPPPVTPSAATDWGRSLRPAFAEDPSLLPSATRYDIDLTVDLDTATITGHEHVAYTNTEGAPLDALYLRLFPNTSGYGGAMTVTGVSINGRPSDFAAELDRSALRLPLDPQLAPGAQLDLALDFTLALPGEAAEGAVPSSSEGYRQLGYYDGTLALANAYPIIPVYDDEGWNVELAPTYGDAIYSDVALYDVRITAPATMTLAASGTCTEPVLTPGGSATWTCVAAPMRDFNAVLGPNYETLSRVVKGITVNSVFYAGHDRGGERALEYASEAVELFDTRFDTYPFTELDVVETPTSAGGIEYPGLVVINSSYYDPISERLEWVVAHEVAHQWWYSLVGNDQVDEPWLDEALAQYSALLHFEDRYGTTVADRLVEQVFRRPYEEFLETERDQPAGLPVAAYNRDDYGPVVYQKGPLYLDALRREVGDDAFWRVLQAYFQRNRYVIASPEDWLAAVETVTGDEHRELYEEWIGNP